MVVATQFICHSRFLWRIFYLSNIDIILFKLSHFIFPCRIFLSLLIMVAQLICHLWFLWRILYLSNIDIILFLYFSHFIFPCRIFFSLLMMVVAEHSFFGTCGFWLQCCVIVSSIISHSISMESLVFEYFSFCTSIFSFCICIQFFVYLYFYNCVFLLQCCVIVLSIISYSISMESLEFLYISQTWYLSLASVAALV